MSFVDELLGPLSDLIPEHRPAQYTLAKACERCFQEKRFGLMEGPCGVGKSLAYLAPAIESARAGKRIVIAVGTNALLDQIASDIPRIAPDVSFATLKGRKNYICPLMASLVQPRPHDDVAVERLMRFVDNGGTDLTKYDESPSEYVRSHATISRDDCKKMRARPGSETYTKKEDHCACEPAGIGCDADEEICPHGKVLRELRCPFLVARRECLSARIVVTNFDLLILNAQKGGAIFGEFHAVILDEAHEFAAKMRDHFTEELGPTLFKNAANGVQDQIGKGVHNEHVNELLLATESFFALVAKYAADHSDRHPEDEPDEALLTDDHGLDTRRLELAVIRLYELGLTISKDKEFIASVDVRKPVERIKEWLSMDNKNAACWVRHHQGRRSIHIAPISVAGLIKTIVHASTKIVIATSATLSPDGSWDYPRAQLAMPENAIEQAVPSPFDFSNQAMWLSPGGMPQPCSHGEQRDRYNQRASVIVRGLVKAVGGRTLVLCSAKKDVRVAVEAISDLGYEVLVQGDRPPAELKRRFRQNVTSCLAGSNTFGTGFDVPGEALQCVVLWKLPFAPQTMIDQAIQKRDGVGPWFWQHYKPAMLIQLRQWVGRLIRNKTDIGIIAILDPRATTGRYGDSIRNAMPPGIKRGISLDDVSNFLRAARRT